jgi:DNA-binding NarL/FixJ family response regulator
LKVVSEAVDARELLTEAKAVLPDLVLLDWELRGLTPAELMPTLRRVCPGLAVVVLSGRPEARSDATEAGADAFVSKTDPPDSLLAAIKDCQQQKPPPPRKE